MKKHLIMVKDMNCEHCKARIENALHAENIQCEINLENKVVSVQGDNDVLALTKRVITKEGYTIL